MKNKKLKTAVFSLGVPLILLLLFSASLLFTGVNKGLTAMLAGLSVSSIAQLLFSRRKYLYDLEETADSVTIIYLDRFIRTHQTAFNKDSFNVISVSESNWWPGYTDSMLISDDKKSILFTVPDKMLHQSVLHKIENAV